MKTQNPTEVLNKEEEQEARKLLSYARSKLAKGNVVGAKNCLLRAERIFPTPEAKELLSEIQSRAQTADNNENEVPGTSGRHQSNPSRNPETNSPRLQGSRQRTSSYRSVELNYTKKQLEAVRRIAKCQNHYEILNVEVNASVEEIKDSYKKLALILHPDKNQAPGAKEAFQALSQATEILSDPIKRKKYEMELQQARENLIISTSSNAGYIDIPGWMIVAGVAVAAAGLFGFWWQKRQEQKRQEQLRQERAMSQDG